MRRGGGGLLYDVNREWVRVLAKYLHKRICQSRLFRIAAAESLERHMPSVWTLLMRIICSQKPMDKDEDIESPKVTKMKSHTEDRGLAYSEKKPSHKRKPIQCRGTILSSGYLVAFCI